MNISKLLLISAVPLVLMGCAHHGDHHPATHGSAAMHKVMHAIRRGKGTQAILKDNAPYDKGANPAAMDSEKAGKYTLPGAIPLS